MRTEKAVYMYGGAKLKRQRFERRQGHTIRRTQTAIVSAGLAALTLALMPPAAADNALAGSTPVDTPLYIDPNQQAIAAAQDDHRFDPIAKTPQAKWFTDWSTSDTAQNDVGEYLAGAAAAHADDGGSVKLFHRGKVGPQDPFARKKKERRGARRAVSRAAARCGPAR